MLSKLPIELCCKIIKLLDTPEILICAETCHEWYEFIKKWKLIQEIEAGTPYQYHSILQAVTKKYIRGDQIKLLKVKGEKMYVVQSIVDIPHLFPELKIFQFDGCSSLCDDESNDTIDGDENKEEFMNGFKQWRYSLERLELFGNASEMMSLIKQCRFERLTHLHLGYYFLPWDRSSRQNYVIPSLLKYLPRLRSLILYSKRISFESIELIHANAPLLEKLELKYSFFAFPSDGIIPSNISPAKKLSYLTIKINNYHSDGQTIFEYILAKYPSLIYLDLVSDIDRSGPLGMDLFPQVSTSLNSIIIPFISNLPCSLKTFRNQLLYTTKLSIDALDKISTRSFSSSSSSSSSSPSSPSFFTSCSPLKLTEFYLFIDYYSDYPIATLDYCFSKSVFKSLERLSMFSFNCSDVYPDNKVVTNIKRLDFYCPGKYSDVPNNIVYLDCIFKVHPLLEKCLITATERLVDIKGNDEDKENDDMNSKKLNVIELSLYICSLSEKVMDFIKCKMPDLKRLSILMDFHWPTRKWNMSSDGKFTSESPFRKAIYLPDHHLDLVELNVPAETNNIICSVQSALEQKKYYQYSKKDHKVKFFSQLPIKVDHDNDTYYVCIVSKSLCHLVVNKIKMF